MGLPVKMNFPGRGRGGREIGRGWREREKGNWVFMAQAQVLICLEFCQNSQDYKG